MEPEQLRVLRSNFTPFLKAVDKALSIELDNEDLENYHKEAVFDEILRKVPTENSTLKLFSRSTQASDTVHNEFDQLKIMNIQ